MINMAVLSVSVISGKSQYYLLVLSGRAVGRQRLKIHEEKDPAEVRGDKCYGVGGIDPGKVHLC